jgi:hypothetical protein
LDYGITNAYSTTWTKSIAFDNRIFAIGGDQIQILD